MLRVSFDRRRIIASIFLSLSLLLPLPPPPLYFRLLDLLSHVIRSSPTVSRMGFAKTRVVPRGAGGDGSGGVGGDEESNARLRGYKEMSESMTN